MALLTVSIAQMRLNERIRIAPSSRRPGNQLPVNLLADTLRGSSRGQTLPAFQSVPKTHGGKIAEPLPQGVSNLGTSRHVAGASSASSYPVNTLNTSKWATITTDSSTPTRATSRPGYQPGNRSTGPPPQGHSLHGPSNAVSQDTLRRGTFLPAAQGTTEKFSARVDPTQYGISASTSPLVLKEHRTRRPSVTTHHPPASWNPPSAQQPSTGASLSNGLGRSRQYLPPTVTQSQKNPPPRSSSLSVHGQSTDSSVVMRQSPSSLTQQQNDVAPTANAAVKLTTKPSLSAVKPVGKPQMSAVTVAKVLKKVDTKTSPYASNNLPSPPASTDASPRETKPAGIAIANHPVRPVEPISQPVQQTTTKQETLANPPIVTNDEIGKIVVELAEQMAPEHLQLLVRIFNACVSSKRENSPQTSNVPQGKSNDVPPVDM
jgi:hypothetical protein